MSGLSGWAEGRFFRDFGEVMRETLTVCCSPIAMANLLFPILTGETEERRKGIERLARLYDLPVEVARERFRRLYRETPYTWGECYELAAANDPLAAAYMTGEVSR